MNVMAEAHRWARSHRGQYAAYKDALAEGLRIMHRRAQAQARGAETRQMWRERQEARWQSMQGIPLLLRDWQSPDYNGIRDFVRER